MEKSACSQSALKEVVIFKSFYLCYGHLLNFPAIFYFAELLDLPNRVKF